MNGSGSQSNLIVRPGWPRLATLRCLAVLILLSLLLSTTSPTLARPLVAPIPAPGLNVPAEGLIGENLFFTVTFDNTSSILTDTGYGPYLDLYLPVRGIDGSPAPGNDGIRLNTNGATYLGTVVQTTTINCNSGSTFTHPLTGISNNCPAAPVTYTGPAPFTWQVNVLRLPFGSFVADQPAIEVDISAALSNLADLDVLQYIRARAGFQFGADPLNNPLTDPVLVSGLVTATVNPILFTLTKTYLGPEDETATGPNFPRRYQLTVNIATGQTVTNLDITDLLPNNMQYLRFISASPAGCAPTIEPAGDAPHNPPDNALIVRCPSVTGTGGDTDAQVEFEYFIPRDDANTLPVIDAASGDDVLSTDDARAEGDWDPIDTRDPDAHPVSDLTTSDHILTDKSIAIQKTVANLSGLPNSPQDTLEYTLSFQVSDYFAFNQVAVQDILSDGQRLDLTFPPTLAVNGNGFALSAAAIDPANYTVTPNYTPASPAPNDGTTTLDLNISAELIRRGAATGFMVGGCVPTSGTGGPVPDCASFNDGATTGTITFRAVIQDQFSDDFAPNTPSVDQGDELTDQVTIAGSLLNVVDLSANGYTEGDGSAAGVVIPRGALSKSIYAINGSTSFASPVRIAAGDTVTYRIQYDLPTSDIERFYFIDYLPLPVFSAAEINSPFDQYAAVPPPAGLAGFGPADTFFSYSGIVPSLTVDPNANSLRFDYGNFDDPRDQPTHVDLLFTVTVRTDPFADGLYLTNQARAHEGATTTPDVDTDAIIQLQLTEPVLRIRKGVVATDNPAGIFNPTTILPVGVTISAPGGSCPRLTGTVNSNNISTRLNSNLTTVDASDLVTFAILVENTGTGLTGAFDVRVRDTLPAGFRIPTSAAGLNLCVTDGTGAPLTFIQNGAGLFGTNAADGLELVDPGTGALAAADPTSGRNVALILYDLQIDPNAPQITPGAVLTNTATLFNYASAEGGADHTTPDLTDPASVTVAPPRNSKALTGTEINHIRNTNTQAVIGEMLDYRVTITLPEGNLPNARLVDTLDSGLVFVECLNITASPELITTLTNFTDACNDPTNPVITGSGRTVTYTLGDITNPNADNAAAETIVIEYRAIVTNITSNQNDTQLNNSAAFRWGASGTLTASASNVQVIEPNLILQKTVTVNGSGAVGDAGDPVEYTINIRQSGSRTDSFDVSLSDPLPSNASGTLIDNPILTSVTDSTGVVGAAMFQLVGSNAAGWTLQTLPGLTFDFPYDTTRVITLTVTGTLSNTVNTGQTVRNTGGIQWSSMDGEPGQRSTYNTSAVERTGAGGTLNNYFANASADIFVISPTLNKQVISTNLPETTDPEIIIGEQIVYEVTYTIPEGMAMTFIASDQLDAGMSFIRCDQITASAALTAANGFSCGLAAFTEFPVGSANPEDSGRLMTLNFGNVTNGDNNNATPETITIRYTVVVTNTAGAQRSVALVNHATGQWISAGNSLIVNASAPAFIVAEPLLETTKIAVPTTGDAGDEITFTVTAGNAFALHQATAYEVVWSDTIPAGMTYVPGSLAVTAGVMPATLDDSGAPVLRATWDMLAPGQNTTFTFRVTLDSSGTPSQQITNQSVLTGTGMLGVVGTPISPYNTFSCERTGNPADCGGSNNDYRVTADAPVSLNDPVFAKALTTTSAAHTPDASVAIGEIVTYTLTVTLPEGTTPNLHIEDTLPPGLAYLDSSVMLDLGTFAGTIAAPVVSSTGGIVTIDFGMITVTPDNNSANNTFTLRLSALVLNDPANQNTITLDNSASFTIGTLSPVTPAPVRVTVVEPELQIEKIASDDTPAFNQEITYTLRLTHLPTSTTDALDIFVTDTVPAGLVYVPGSITVPAGWTVDESAAPTLAFGGNLTLAQNTLDLTYRARLADFSVLTLRDPLTNTARATWTSLPGLDAGERTGDGGVNDYAAQVDETVIVSGPDLRISKSDGGVTGEPGLPVIYTLTFENTGNADAPGVVLTETIPTYTTSDPSNAATGWVCLPNDNPGSICTLTLGTLLPGESRSIPFALLIDATLPTTVTSIRNTVTIADDGSNGPDPTPDNNIASDITPLFAVPDIVVQKTDELDIVAPAMQLTYTLTITNAGDQDATGVQITDTLPVGVTFVSASDGGVQSAGVVTWPVINLDALQSVTRSVTVRVNQPYDGPTDQITNSVEAHDDGSNGDDPTPDNNTATDVDEVAENLTKQVAGTNVASTLNANVAIGERVTYEATLIIPPGYARDMVVTDTLDAGLAFLSCDSITASAGLLSDPDFAFATICSRAEFLPEPVTSTAPENAGRTMRLSFGIIQNNTTTNATLTLRYTVVVLNSSANVRSTSLANRVRWQWDGGDLTTRSTPVTVVEPQLSLVKNANPRIAMPGAWITFRLTVAHTPQSDSDAYDVVLTDIVPRYLKYLPDTLVYISGQPPSSLDDSSAPTLRIRWNNFANNGENSIIEFKAELGLDGFNASVTNTAAVEWSSLPGSVRDPQSSENSLSTERFYDPTSNVNTYGANAKITIYTPDELPGTGFAPGRITTLPVQPAEKQYQNLGDLWLEIPSLNLKVGLVGVPALMEGWDVSWLNNQAGYLEGTAFPGWEGNSVITAHVYNANGQPGPFVNLKQLKWGEEIILHAFGQVSRYQVRQVRAQVSPDDLSLMRHEDYSYLTLVTCEGYQPDSNAYRWRVGVRAVLVKIEPTP